MTNFPVFNIIYLRKESANSSLIIELFFKGLGGHWGDYEYLGIGLQVWATKHQIQSAFLFA